MQDLISVYKYFKSLHPSSKFLFVGYSYGSIITGATINQIPREDIVGLISISYPYSVLWFLTFFNSQKFIQPLQEEIKKGLHVLLIMGEKDNFTGVNRFNEFIETIGVVKNHNVEIVKGCDHFWMGVEERLVTITDSWLSG